MKIISIVNVYVNPLNFLWGKFTSKMQKILAFRANTIPGKDSFKDDLVQVFFSFLF